MDSGSSGQHENEVGDGQVVVMVAVLGEPTETPGLVVTAGLGKRHGTAVLTHVGTGRAIPASFRDEDAAHLAAARLGAIADWTTDVLSTWSTADARQAKAIVLECGGWL